jgi:hypothetical protein
MIDPKRLGSPSHSNSLCHKDEKLNFTHQTNNSNNCIDSPTHILDEDPYYDNKNLIPHHVSHDRANPIFKSFGVSNEEAQKPK